MPETKTKFYDTMKHLPGSLKKLAEGFASDFQIAKGYFPHLFNSHNNIDYVGRIPPKYTFDMSFTARKPSERIAFDKWYDEQATRTDWCLKDELIKYCENDVDVLAVIVKEYNNNIMEITGFSPWIYPTAPGCAHDYIRDEVYKSYEIPDDMEKLEKDALMSEIANEKGWAVLFAAEYFFARGALRGGRTDTRCHYYKLSQEQIDSGIKICYQDIVSQYPFQQVAHKFPVGAPLVEVYDMSMKPCEIHAMQINEGAGDCRCSFKNTTFVNWKKPNELREPTKEEILERCKTKGGFIYADVQPPDNLYHPVLIGFDHETGKAVASLKRIKGHFTLLEFCVALENGYTINKVYRIDWYNMEEGLWADCVKKLYLRKMMFSKNMPSAEQQTAIINEYEEHFEMGDMIRRSFEQRLWVKSDSKKQTSKTMLNSGWGKHAQRPFMNRTVMFDRETDMHHEFLNLFTEKTQVVSLREFGNESTLMTTKHFSKELPPNLKDGYIAAAAYVPAYGRIQLWREMNKLGKRVLYHDTDSLIYVYDPQLYNIPEGKRLGEWEIEDVDKDNGGIVEFVSAGPKTYGFKTRLNDQTVVKCKGIALKDSMRALFNFETLKKNVLEGLYGVAYKMQIPQSFFKYKTTAGFRSYTDLKNFGFDPKAQKGFIHGAYQYPLGYRLSENE